MAAHVSLYFWRTDRKELLKAVTQVGLLNEVSKNETSTHARCTKSPLETDFALLHLRVLDR